jgi:spore germination protein GerM
MGIIGSGLFLMKNKETGAPAVSVYFFYHERLYPVQRTLAADEHPLKRALVELINGPRAEERKQGLQTLLPQGLAIKQMTLADSKLTLYFSKEILAVSGGYETIEGMLKQIVYTATNIPGITSVTIRVVGHPNSALALGGEGYIISAPLARDYFKE